MDDRVIESDRSAWWVFLAVALALLVLRLGVLMATDLTLGGDEAQYWTWSLTPDFGYYSKPPLIAWVIGAATSVCGDATWCIRAPAVLFHVGTAIALALLARDVAGNRAAAWTGIVWLTLPAVSLSSLIMSTDALLLFFWSVALLAYRTLLLRPGPWPAVVLALAIGLGLNAKYAMVYFLLCLLVHLAIAPEARRRAAQCARPLQLAIIVGFAMLVPNLIWNAVHGWATMGHTADNAHWQGLVLHPGKMWAFIQSQFGVFGPILFAFFLMMLPVTRRRIARLDGDWRMLLAFSVPILIGVSVLALLSRAHANWAATAFPAATVLVTRLLLATKERRGWLGASVALHTLVMAIGYVAVVAPGLVSPPLPKNAFADLRGWQDTADKVYADASANGIRTVLMDDRMMIASLAYALRNRPITIRAWNPDSRINNHYEMAWAYNPAKDGKRVLLVTPHGMDGIIARFDTARRMPDIVRHGRSGRTVTLGVAVLEGPK